MIYKTFQKAIDIIERKQESGGIGYNMMTEMIKDLGA